MGATGGARDDLGGKRCTAGVDRALRNTAGVVRGLEEPVQATGQCTGAVARRRAYYPVWTHVREARHRSHSGQLTASQGSRRAEPRYASGSAGEEAPAEGDPESRA